jgi:hypothetical protein
MKQREREVRSWKDRINRRGSAEIHIQQSNNRWGRTKRAEVERKNQHRNQRETPIHPRDESEYAGKTGRGIAKDPERES